MSGNKSFEGITNSKQFVKTSFIAIPQIYCFKESFEQSVFRQSAVTSNLSLFLTRTQHSLPPPPSHMSLFTFRLSWPFFSFLLLFFLPSVFLYSFYLFSSFFTSFLFPICVFIITLSFPSLFISLISLCHLCYSFFCLYYLVCFCIFSFSFPQTFFL